MSIIITNISEHPDEFGINDYVVKIGRKEICRFQHVRSEGLMRCLLDAAFAVSEANKDGIVEEK